MSTDAPLTPDFNLLPNDPQLLKQMIADLMVELSKKDGRIEQLQHRMDLLLRKLYGASSEKFDPRQASLFETAPSEPAAAETTLDPAAGNAPESESETSRAASSRPGHGRRKLPDTLKTVEVIQDLTDAEKAAMGGEENLVCIGQEATEQVEWEPSCLYRILHIQKKYARKLQLAESGPSLSEKNVLLASKPPQPIEGGLPGPHPPKLKTRTNGHYSHRSWTRRHDKGGRVQPEQRDWTKRHVRKESNPRRRPQML